MRRGGVGLDVDDILPANRAACSIIIEVYHSKLCGKLLFRWFERNSCITDTDTAKPPSFFLKWGIWCILPLGLLVLSKYIWSVTGVVAIRPYTGDVATPQTVSAPGMLRKESPISSIRILLLHQISSHSLSQHSSSLTSPSEKVTIISSHIPSISLSYHSALYTNESSDRI